MITKVLDCSLRDGGYVNEWNFGKQNIGKVIANLTKAFIDYIEIGFMKAAPYDEDKTLFRYLSDIKKFIPEEHEKSKYYAMITYGKYPLEDIPENDGSTVDGIRVIFKKDQKNDALKYCRVIKEQGYDVFINPTYTNQYSDCELLDLVTEVNRVHPVGLSIVDTMGVMDATSLVRMFMLIDHNLKQDIAVCFHSHNNLQQSFSCAQRLLELRSNREIIIDSSVQGIGRGAGNLCTELLLKYLNDNYGKKYNLLPVLRIISEQTNKIYAVKPWGYTIPYYLAASAKCHPNYASFLTDKASINVEKINEILTLIPKEKKSNYDERLIQELYLHYQEHEVDDRDVCEKLKRSIEWHKVLLLASGRSIIRCREIILSYIKEHSPYVMSLNFVPKGFAVDRIFISNALRYEEQANMEGVANILVTSNIKAEGVDTLNYGSYLNNSALPDNCALMLLKLLISIGAKEVVFAGMDGFSGRKDDYFDVSMVNNGRLREFDQRNEVMREMLHTFSKEINIHFLTPSLYEW